MTSPARKGRPPEVTTNLPPIRVDFRYLSQNDSRLHFGLELAAAYHSIEVEWPGGDRELFAGGPANHIVTVKQGGGSPAPRR